MSIRYKYLLLFPMMALVPVLVFYYFTNHYITDGLMNIQLSRLERDVLAFRLQLAAEGSQLKSMALAYSHWNELYDNMPYSTPQNVAPMLERSLKQNFTDLQVAVVNDENEVIYIGGNITREDVSNIVSKLKRQFSDLESGHSFEQVSGSLSIVAFSRFFRESGTSSPRGYLILVEPVERLKIQLEAAVELPFIVYIGRSPAVSGNISVSPEKIGYPMWRNLYTRFIEGEEYVSLSDKSSFLTAMYAPLRGASGNIAGILQITSSDEDLMPVKLNLDRTTIVIFAVVALLSVFIAFITSYYLSVRITRLSEATRDVLSGENLIPIKSRIMLKDELDELLINFTRMKRELDDYFQQLIASEVKYRRVVNTSITGLFVYSNGRYQFANARFEEITGYTIEELNSTDTLGYVHQSDREKFVENVVVRMGIDTFRQPVDTRITTKKGDERIINVRTESIDYQNEPALLGHILDVTEQRELEKRLFQSQKLEAIGTLAGGIAHDFNNVIGGIIGFAEMLDERYEHDRRITDVTKRIITLGRRGSRLVKNLLAFARGESTIKEVIDVVDSIKRTLEIFVLQKHLNIEMECIFPEHKLHVLFSPVQFEQMLINLLVNARDAMPEGGKIILSVAGIVEADSDSTDTLVEIKLIDTGIGIPKDYLGRIFDPFFTTKEVGKGTGLGLAVVYGIVEEHGGTISVQSESMEGTEFVIRFPVVLKTDEVAVPEKIDKTVEAIHSD